MTDSGDKRTVHTADTKDRVVEMYQAGARTADIEAETGVPRPSIYMILKQQGIQPSRQKARVPMDLTVDQLLEQLAGRDRTIGRLQARVEELEADLSETQNALKEQKKQARARTKKAGS